MPALLAFGKKWNISNDDFVFPGTILFFTRLTWLIVISVVFSHHQSIFHCDRRNVLVTYYIGMMILLPLKMVVNVMLIYISAQGRILDYWKRKHVTKILYAKTVLLLLELVWNSIATYWAYSDSSDCAQEVVLTVKILTGFAWGGFLIIIITLVMLNPVNKNMNPTDSSRMWKRRCKMVCCTFGNDENTNSVYEELADLVSSFFLDLDLVPTDIAAGLILVSKAQTKRANHLTSVSHDSSVAGRAFGDRNVAVDITPSVTDVQPQPWMTIPRAAHFMKFALACYGWPMYSLAHLPFGCCILCCAEGPQAKLGPIVADNCCKCNISAVKRTLPVKHTEIHYASFHNELFEIPFMILRDHKDKSVVIAIRGTLSLKDAMVDMTAAGERVDDDAPAEHLAHKGILKAAYTLKRKLISNCLLESAFLDGYTDYNLVICGHSLGAGVAALLTIIMKEIYPNVQCFSFSPPGGLLSIEAAESSKDHIMSIVVGSDLVPRLGIQQMEDLKMRILQALEVCSRPKYTIFASTFCKMCTCYYCRDSTDDEAMASPLVIGGRQPSYAATPNSLTESLHEAIATSHRSIITQPAFYPPGIILHINNIHAQNRRCCGPQPDYRWQWSQRSNFSELLVTPRMVADHMPDLVLQALEQLSPDFQDDWPATSNNLVV